MKRPKSRACCSNTGAQIDEGHIKVCMSCQNAKSFEEHPFLYLLSIFIAPILPIIIIYYVCKLFS